MAERPGNRNDRANDDRVTGDRSNNDCSSNDRLNNDVADDPRAPQDRRRSPRFACGGEAKISCLPSDGIFLPGRIRDLSLGGCCLDTILPIDFGARTEVVLRVNAASFRAVGIVRALRDKSATGIEFVQLSVTGKQLLAELVKELASWRVMMSNLSSARREMDAESFRRHVEAGRLQAVMFATRFPFLDTPFPVQSLEQNEVASVREVLSAENELLPRAKALVLPVNLFG